MKKRRRVLIAIAMLMLSIVLLGCQNAGSQTNSIVERIENSENPVITWGVKADTNLFGQYNIEEGEIVGFDVDIAKEMTDRMTDGKGTAEIVEATAKTRIPLLVNGNIDGILATMTINESRVEQINFSDVYFAGGQSLLVHEDSGITGIDDLTSDDVVLGIKGTTGTQTFRELRPDVEILDLENYSEAFVALKAGQGTALTSDNSILLGIAAQNPGYRLAGENFTTEPYGIATAKNQEGFQALIDETLDDMIADGTYQEIYNKWFGDILPNEDVEAELAEADAWVAENIYVPYYENNPEEGPEGKHGAAASLDALEE